MLAPGITNGASTVLFIIICAGNRFRKGKKIVTNKYKNKWDESNHNSNICNIEHLTLEMAHHCSQQLHSTVLNEEY